MRSFFGWVRGGRRLRLAAALAAAIFTLGACGAGSQDAGDAGASEASTTSTTSAAGSAADPTPKTDELVQMTDALRFNPPDIVLKAGGKVTWTNPSTVVHSATGDPGKVADASHVELPAGAAPWDSGLLQGTGSFTQVFTVPGTYRYACIPHETVNMFGTITVVP
ncbi:MAG: plastocyanin/azurin family copper-binding protein [Actinomycetota bacterium]|jgi:plastocyanin